MDPRQVSVTFEKCTPTGPAQCATCQKKQRTRWEGQEACIVAADTEARPYALLKKCQQEAVATEGMQGDHRRHRHSPLSVRNG